MKRDDSYAKSIERLTEQAMVRVAQLKAQGNEGWAEALRKEWDLTKDPK